MVATHQTVRMRPHALTQTAQAGISQFIEKPLSVKPPEEVAQLSERLLQLQKEKNLIIAVGYMLRYSPAVEVSPAGCSTHLTAAGAAAALTQSETAIDMPQV